ncbi:MAG: FkbM family methyltransferase [Cyclobacteriaceae bacterium]
MRKIYRKCKEKGINPVHVAEVGVYIPEESNVLDFIRNGIKTTLVEAHPTYVQMSQNFFKNDNNVSIHPVAVYDEEGEITLMHRDASTFLETIDHSPSIVNDYYQPEEGDRITVKCTKFSTIDDGTIDLLSVDIEGAEWYAIKHLVSRPMVISIETHGKRYKNPFINEIRAWMNTNNYTAWYRDKSDTVYVHAPRVKITSADHVALVLQNVRLKARTVRSYISELLKSLFNSR